jgi:16S rRNA (cytosine1407-C5)-methyltransferase
MRPITENEIQSLAERQFRLLESALQAVKIGGQVVYSTCTLSPYENEGVVSRILHKYSKEVEMEDIQDKLPAPAPAIIHIEGVQLQEQVKKAVRLWPHIFGTAGFFCAKFIKKGAIPSGKRMDTHGKKPKKRNSYFKEKESHHLTDMISGLYGFDLKNVIDDQSLSYWQFKENIYLTPSQLAIQFPELPVHSMGMLVGKYFPKGWQPSHEFVSRFGDLFTENIYILDNEHHDAWIRGEDIRNIKKPERLTGKILAIRDANDRNLGRGKMLSNRLKNMLPTRLF